MPNSASASLHGATLVPARGPSAEARMPAFRLRRAAPAQRRIVVGVAAVLLAAACWRIASSFGHRLWLDELYTATLIDVPGLGRVWDGALRGVDGNPPLYLTLAWGLVHAMPSAAAAPERVLRGLNLLLLVGTAVLVRRIGLRVAPAVAVVAGLAALCAVDEMPDFLLLEIRTYALYLFLVVATLSATLDAVDKPTRRRTLAVAAFGVLATLSHSFGGFYALVTIGSGALACGFARDRRAAAILALAALPTLAAAAAWIAVSLPVQSAMADPYGWIPRTGLSVLSAALTGAPALTPVVAVAALAAAGKAAAGWLRLRRPETCRPDGSPRPGRTDGPEIQEAPGRPASMALHLALAGYAAITVAAAVASQFVRPFFVPRYFAPNVLIAAVFLVRVAGLLFRDLRPGRAGAAALACALLGSAALAQDDDEGDLIPCVDGAGRFLEAGLPLGGLPVIAESPHAWLPRVRYAPERATLYPLDWRVVVDYPARARNNATDFHIMDVLHRWADPGSALARDVATTDEIVARHASFFLLDETSRGWLDELRSHRRVAVTTVGQGPGCRLLRVELGGGDR